VGLAAARWDSKLLKTIGPAAEYIIEADRKLVARVVDGLGLGYADEEAVERRTIVEPRDSQGDDEADPDGDGEAMPRSA